MNDLIISGYWAEFRTLRSINIQEEGYFVNFPELPGCYGYGEKLVEAIKDAEGASELWLRVGKERGSFIPRPHDPRIQAPGFG